MSREWLSYAERSNLLALRAITWIALRLGRPAARALLYPICAYFVVSSARMRRASRDYLSRILGRRVRARDVFRHYHTFAATVLDRVFLLTGRHRDFDLRVSGADVVDRLLREHRGCILLGSHLGSFEATRATAANCPEMVVKLVMYPENARKVGQLFEMLDPRLKEVIISLGRPEALLRIQECIARGEFVGLLGDRVLAEGKTVMREFLGEKAAFSLGPLQLAATLQAPVVLMFGLYRGGRRYDIHFELFAEELRVDRRNRADELGLWVGRYVQRLEHYCRLAPYNWFNFYEYWDSHDAS